MQIAALPITIAPPITGWHFAGPWCPAEQEMIARTLRERILAPDQARDHPWLFLAHGPHRYASCSAIHAAGTGYIASTADELADVLWDHYFALRLGPLAWAAPAAAEPRTPTEPELPAPAAPTAPSGAGASFDHWLRIIDHIQAAHRLLAEGDAAAAKREIELSFAIAPPDSFFDSGRVTLAGDIASALGDDTAALHAYQQALGLTRAIPQDWTTTDLRLKLAWCALRLGRIDDAYAQVEMSLQHCAAAQPTETAARRPLNHMTAMAFATRAEIAFRRADISAARAAASQAVTMAGRLGSMPAERVRLLTYLAWQFYLHGEHTDARTVATRARQALEQWMPLDAQHVRAIRGTLAVVLGGLSPSISRAPTTTALPSIDALTEQALAAVRAMPDWLPQVRALHILAPYLSRHHIQRRLNGLRVLRHQWDDDDPAYVTVVRADLVHARACRRDTPLRAARRLIRANLDGLASLGNLWLYAEALVRLRPQLDPTHSSLIDRRIARCASQWLSVIRRNGGHWCVTDASAGLAVLLPHLPTDVRTATMGTLAEVLLVQVQDDTVSDTVLRTIMPVMARYRVGAPVAQAILARDNRSREALLACLGYLLDEDASEVRDAIIASLLRRERELLVYRSTSACGATVIGLAPYLRPEQAHEALALITAIRSIGVRVCALCELGAILPDDERAVVYQRAYEAAQRTKNANVRGEALATIVSHVAQWRAEPDHRS